MTRRPYSLLSMARNKPIHNTLYRIPSTVCHCVLILRFIILHKLTDDSFKTTIVIQRTLLLVSATLQYLQPLWTILIVIYSNAIRLRPCLWNQLCAKRFRIRNNPKLSTTDFTFFTLTLPSDTNCIHLAIRRRGRVSRARVKFAVLGRTYLYIILLSFVVKFF